MKVKNFNQKIRIIVGILFLSSISSLSANTCGDVNLDNQINIIDALLIARYYVEDIPAFFDPKAADVNNNSTIDIIDALLIAQYYVGSIEKLPACEKSEKGEWKGRIKLSFKNKTQREILKDFPLLVVLNKNRIDYSQTQNKGQDIRFADSKGELLAHEIEKWNESGSSFVWVKVPQINPESEDNYIWLYYNNPLAKDEQDIKGVWTNNYKMVYHLTNPKEIVPDSTINNFIGKNQKSSLVKGVIGGAGDFNGIDAYIDLGKDLPVLNGVKAASLSAWIKPESLEERHDIIAISINDSEETYFSRASICQYGNEVGLIARAPDSQASNMIETRSQPLSKNWHYVVAVIDYSKSEVNIYVDGKSQALTEAPNFANQLTDTTNSNTATLGTEDNAHFYFFHGQIDEVRVAAAERSEDWITAQYASMKDNFLIYGKPESIPFILNKEP